MLEADDAASLTRPSVGTPRVTLATIHTPLFFTRRRHVRPSQLDRPRKKSKLAPSRAELKLTAEIASAARRAHELHAKQTKLRKEAKAGGQQLDALLAHLESGVSTSPPPSETRTSLLDFTVWLHRCPFFPHPPPPRGGPTHFPSPGALALIDLCRADFRNQLCSKIPLNECERTTLNST